MQPQTANSLKTLFEFALIVCKAHSVESQLQGHDLNPLWAETTESNEAALDCGEVKSSARSVNAVAGNAAYDVIEGMTGARGAFGFLCKTNTSAEERQENGCHDL